MVYKILGNFFIKSEFCGFFGTFTSCLIANFRKISNRKSVTTIISQLLPIPSAYSEGLPCFLVGSSVNSACWVMRSLFCCKMHLYRWVIMISKQNNFPLSFESDPGLLWVCLSLICDWSRKNSRHHLNQSNTKVKPILIRSLTFSRASSRLPVFTLSSHWLNMPLTFALIVCCYYFGKCSLTHNWKRLLTIILMN